MSRRINYDVKNSESHTNGNQLIIQETPFNTDDWRSNFIEQVWSKKQNKKKNVWTAIERVIKILPYLMCTIIIMYLINTRKSVHEMSSEYRSLCRHESLHKNWSHLSAEMNTIKSNLTGLTEELKEGWTMFTTYSNITLGQILDLEDKNHEIDVLKEKITKTLNQVIPIGFIYTQFPFQSEPSILWNWAVWQQITANYSGHFFRAEGGNSAPFNESQLDSMQEHSIWQLAKPIVRNEGRSYKSWTEENLDISLKQARMSNETRPINYAVRIWQRIA